MNLNIQIRLLGVSRLPARSVLLNAKCIQRSPPETRTPKTPTEKIKKKGDKKMSEAVYKIKDLSEDEFNFITEFMKEIKNLISKISAMTQEERLAWYEKFQYPRPINFEKKIDGTVYSVNSHFNQKSNEPLVRKIERIILKEEQ